MFSGCANNGHGEMALQVVVRDRDVGDVQGVGVRLSCLPLAGQTVGRRIVTGNVEMFGVCCEHRKMLGSKETLGE